VKHLPRVRAGRGVSYSLGGATAHGDRKIPGGNIEKRVLTALTVAAVMGGLAPIAVSLEPADCPTEAQLSRVLVGLGAKLVPFGSPARATVFAQRDAAGEWSLTLGRPGSNEKRKVKLEGGCDEKAAALGAIIERFARPVIIAAQREAQAQAAPPIDAGSFVDAGVPEPVDAGVAEPPPPPPPPPVVLVVTPLPAPEVADAGVPPAPAERLNGIGARAGVAGSSAGVVAVFSATYERRWKWVGFGGGIEYFGPFVRSAGRVDSFRPFLFARLRLFDYFALEGGAGGSFIWAGPRGIETPDLDIAFHPAVEVAAHGIYPFELFDLWLTGRGWIYISPEAYLGSLQWPVFVGEVLGGVQVKF
jgi:hypothetical protein